MAGVRAWLPSQAPGGRKLNAALCAGLAARRPQPHPSPLPRASPLAAGPRSAAPAGPGREGIRGRPAAAGPLGSTARRDTEQPAAADVRTLGENLLFPLGGRKEGWEQGGGSPGP